MDDEDLFEAECRKRVGTGIGGKWHLDRLLGVGGMAAVYGATHRNGRTAALKLLHEKYAQIPQVRERFLREAYIANKINHPGVVRVDDDDVTPTGQPFLVMELLDGESLERVQTRYGGKVPPVEVMRLLERVLDVMEEAHAAGIVHRDLKPENLFLTRDGQVKVLDFGIARLLEATEGQSRTRTGLVMGTPAFMAPEQALGRWSKVDARTDLWAIGAIAFTMITGRMVHDAPSGNETLVLAASKPAPSLARFSDAPLSVVRCVDRALAYDQAKRFEDAASMHGDVLRVLAELTRAAPAPVVHSSRPPVSRASPPPAEHVSVPPRRASLPGGRVSLPRITRPPAPSRPGSSAPPVTARPRSSAPPAHIPSLDLSIEHPSAAPLRAGPEAETLYDPARDERERRAEEVLEAFDERFAGSGDAGALAEAFRQLENALFTRQQYGAAHPETARQFERAFKACEKALAQSDEALVWRVTPYAFTLGESVVWEPRAPFDRIPYQLFADGVRLIGLLSGVRQDEIIELLRVITLDRVRDVSPDDDFVTLLWDANFEHVVYQAIDTFSEGEQASRAAFEKAAGEITALANFDTSFQLEECWQDAQRGAGVESAAGREERLKQLLSLGATRDREALVQAESFQLRDLGPDTGSAGAVDIDATTLEVVRARLSDTAGVDERFVKVLAEAFRAGRRLNAAGAITVPLRATLDGLAESAPAAAARFVTSLFACFDDREAPGEGAELRGALARGVVSERALRALLATATDTDPSPASHELVREILAVSGNAFVPVVLETFLQGRAGALIGALSDYLARNAEGHEEDIATAFAGVDLDTGLALVRILGRLGTPAAGAAVLRAAESPHAVVRIEALAHLDSAGERLRLELRTLIEDPAPEVRISALRAIRERQIKAAGPALAMRAKSPAFDRLSVDERRQILTTLASLAPARAEELCAELLGDSRLLTISAHEESRALAAEVLGQIASTRESLAALDDASTGRFRYSERVRTSAVFAKEQAVLRLSQQPPAPVVTSRPAPPHSLHPEGPLDAVNPKRRS